MERMFERFQCNLPCEVRARDGLHEARVRNISLGGCFVETGVALVPSTGVELRIDPRDGAPASRILGLIVQKSYVRPHGSHGVCPGFGLEVVETDPAFIELIARAAVAAEKPGRSYDH